LTSEGFGGNYFSMMIYKDEVEASFDVSKNVRETVIAKTSREKFDLKSSEFILSSSDSILRFIV